MPQALSAFLACHLVPLNKNPGVRPIGVGEVLRCIIGKDVMKVARNDILHAAGPLQTCSGLPSGREAAVHAVRESFENPTVEGVLLVDASNVFNSMNATIRSHGHQRFMIYHSKHSPMRLQPCLC